MAAFITLTKRGMYNDAQGEVTVNVDHIVSMERDEDYRQTEVRTSFGRSFCVSEGLAKLNEMIKEARDGDKVD